MGATRRPPRKRPAPGARGRRKRFSAAGVLAWAVFLAGIGAVGTVSYRTLRRAPKPAVGGGAPLAAARRESPAPSSPVIIPKAAATPFAEAPTPAIVPPASPFPST